MPEKNKQKKKKYTKEVLPKDTMKKPEKVFLIKRKLK